MTRFTDLVGYAKSDSRTISDKVREVVKSEVDRSSLFNFQNENSIPKLKVDEIKLGKVVGRGGFCKVRELTEIRLQRSLNPYSECEGVSNSLKKRSTWMYGNFDSRVRLSRSASTSAISNQHLTGREYLARRVWSKGGKLVVKHVDSSLFDTNRVSYLKGLIDLELEIKYLTAMNHPHIMQVRGICSSGVCGDKIPESFIIMDCLAELLSQRLNSWMHAYRATRGLTGLVTCGKQRASSLMTERLLVAYDIAEAMNYIHSKNVIYRDLKPDNIGFDGDGVLKIFDFGLAKELPLNDRSDDGCYNMTGMTGALRYMAPEVGLGLPYNLKADVYSWSMIFWFIMVLEPPMGYHTPTMFVENVFKGVDRPAIHDCWSPTIRQLFKCSWHKNIKKRPEFTGVMSELRNEIQCIDTKVAGILNDKVMDTQSVATTLLEV